MNLANLSIAELNILKASIDSELVGRKEAERDNVLKEIAELARARGYVLDELIGKSVKKPKSGTRKPAAIKYRHPDDQESSWSGRGRQPVWVKEWVASGKAIEKLLVK